MSPGPCEEGRLPAGDIGRDPGGVDVEAKRDGVDRRIRFGGKKVCGDDGRSLMFDTSFVVLEDLVVEAAWGRDCMDWPTDPSSLGCMRTEGSRPSTTARFRRG